METRNRNPIFNRLIFEFPPNNFHTKIIKARDRRTSQISNLVTKKNSMEELSRVGPRVNSATKLNGQPINFISYQVAQCYETRYTTSCIALKTIHPSSKSRGIKD